jgi:hypothetical protein
VIVALLYPFLETMGQLLIERGFIFDDGNKYALTQTDPGTIINLKGYRVPNNYRER